MSVEIRVENALKLLREKLHDLNSIPRVLIETGVAIKRESKRLVPVRTGALRHSIRLEYPPYYPTGEVWVRVVAGDRKIINYMSNVPTSRYARPVEFGTKRTRPHPYLVPAFRRNIHTLKRKLEKVLR